MLGYVMKKLFYIFSFLWIICTIFGCRMYGQAPNSKYDKYSGQYVRTVVKADKETSYYITLSVIEEYYKNKKFSIEETAPDHSYFFGKFSPIFPSWIWIGAYFEENNEYTEVVIKCYQSAEGYYYTAGPSDILKKIDQKIRPINATAKKDLSQDPKKVYNETLAQIKEKLPTQSVHLSNAQQNIIKRWAVIIGISNYKDIQIPSLRYASNDAIAVYNWCVSKDGGRFTPSEVKLLLDENATTHNIKDVLFNWLGQAIQEDMVIIYFVGHGSPQSPDHPHNLYLLSYDTQYDNIAATGFPMWDIETALKRFIKANKVVVIADACHSGGVGQPFDIARRATRGITVNPISSGFQNLSQIGDGVCVISASDDKQFSQESKDWGGGHGVFTYFLLEGLNGNADYNKDTIVTLGELIPYLSEQVRRATRNAQSPTVAGKFDPALSIKR
jgi:hypothetical protein